MSDLLYHYCSLEAFESIVTNQTLRLSDITKSNDSMELSWLEKQVLPKAIEIQNGKTPLKEFTFQFPYSKKNYRGHEAIINLIEWMKDREDKDKMFTSLPLVCSFSEEGDLLSQWRGYGNDGTGVSIGFDKTELKGIFSPFETNVSIMNLKKIIYQEDEQIELISDDVKTFFDSLISALTETTLVSETRAHDAIIKLLVYLMYKSPECKNPFFKEEKEWRVFINFPNNISNINPTKRFKETLLEPKFSSIFTPLSIHTRGEKMVHFTDFRWGNIAPSIIKEIWIGPKSQLTTDDVRSLLDIQGVKNQQEIRIFTSKGSYR